MARRLDHQYPQLTGAASPQLIFRTLLHRLPIGTDADDENTVFSLRGGPGGDCRRILWDVECTYRPYLICTTRRHLPRH